MYFKVVQKYGCVCVSCDFSYWHRNGNLKHQAVVERLLFREDWVILGDSVEDVFFGRENYRFYGGRTFVSLTANDLV